MLNPHSPYALPSFVWHGKKSSHGPLFSSSSPHPSLPFFSWIFVEQVVPLLPPSPLNFKPLHHKVHHPPWFRLQSLTHPWLVIYLSPFYSCTSFWPRVLSNISFKAIYLQLFTSQNALKEFTFDLRSLLWYHLLHSVTPWCHSNVAPF
jgi:hypothetical protein